MPEWWMCPDGDEFPTREEAIAHYLMVRADNTIPVRVARSTDEGPVEWETVEEDSK